MQRKRLLWVEPIADGEFIPRPMATAHGFYGKPALERARPTIPRQISVKSMSKRGLPHLPLARCRGPLRRAARLLLVCGVEQGTTEPVGARTIGLNDRVLNPPELISAKPHPNKFPQGFALGFLWSADFARHIKIFSVSQNLILNQSVFCATNIQVSIGTAPSLDRVAGTAAGESELTNSLPVRAGASRRESEMKTGTLQARSLAIEATGDFFYNKVKPKIRLSGRWLENAGFLPGNRVEVTNTKSGVLILRHVTERKEVAS